MAPSTPTVRQAHERMELISQAGHEHVQEVVVQAVVHVVALVELPVIAFQQLTTAGARPDLTEVGYNSVLKLLLANRAQKVAASHSQVAI